MKPNRFIWAAVVAAVAAGAFTYYTAPAKTKASTQEPVIIAAAPKVEAAPVQEEPMAPPAPAVRQQPVVTLTPVTAAQASDYRYNLALKVCKTRLDPASKARDVAFFNSKTDEQYAALLRDCGTAAAIQSRAQAIPVREAMVSSPYIRQVNRADVPDDEERVLARRARRLLGERGIEGRYSHQTLDTAEAPRPGCIRFGAPVKDRKAISMHQRWHCRRDVGYGSN